MIIDDDNDYDGSGPAPSGTVEFPLRVTAARLAIKGKTAGSTAEDVDARDGGRVFVTNGNPDIAAVEISTEVNGDDDEEEDEEVDDEEEAKMAEEEEEEEAAMILSIC